MAERRMFAKQIIDSDAFIDMPVTARLLYYDLGMRADDDGFVNSPKKIMRMIGASQDDLAILISKKFIIPFESGVVVIKHWRIHNYIRGDRKHDTKYEKEMAQLTVKENGSYSLSDTCQSSDSQLTGSCPTEVRLGKDSLGKVKDIYTADADEIIDYLNGKIGSHYRHTDSNRKGIKARLNDGFTVDDCKTVIDKKTTEWLHTDMEKHLNPETLFRPSKFEKYLNAPISKPKNVVIPQPDFITNQTEEDIPPWLRNDA